MNTKLIYLVFLLIFSNIVYATEYVGVKEKAKETKGGDYIVSYKPLKFFGANNNVPIESTDFLNDRLECDPTFYNDYELNSYKHGGGNVWIGTPINAAGALQESNRSHSFENENYSTFLVNGTVNHINVRGTYKYQCKVFEHVDGDTTKYQTKSWYEFDWNDTVYEVVTTNNRQSTQQGQKCTTGEGCNKCSGINCPIYADSGSLFHNEVDFTWDIGSIGLSIAREYLSKRDKESPFGYGWSFNHNVHLNITSARVIADQEGALEIYVNRPNYKSIYFLNKDANNLDKAVNITGSDEDLIKLEPNGKAYLLKSKSGDFLQYFDNLGKLVEVSNHITKHEYEYDNNTNLLSTIKVYIDKNRVPSVVDFSLEFTYNDVNKKIETIIDSFGRVLKYEYDETNNLVAVTDFDGKVERYEYDQHRLINVSSKKGDSILQATYTQDGEVDSFTEYGQLASVVHETVDGVTSLQDTYDGLNTKYQTTDPTLNFQYKTERNQYNLETKRFIDNTLVRDITYNDNRQIQSIKHATGLIEYFYYDDEKRLITQVAIDSDNVQEIIPSKFDLRVNIQKDNNIDLHYYKWVYDSEDTNNKPPFFEDEDKCGCMVLDANNLGKYRDLSNGSRVVFCDSNKINIESASDKWCVYPDLKPEYDSYYDETLNMGTASIDEIVWHPTDVNTDNEMCALEGEGITDSLDQDDLYSKIYDALHIERKDPLPYYKFNTATGDCLTLDLKNHPDAHTTQYEYTKVNENTENEKVILKRVIDPLGNTDTYTYYGEINTGHSVCDNSSDILIGKVCTSKSKNGINLHYTYTEYGFPYQIIQILDTNKILVTFSYNDANPDEEPFNPSQVKNIARYGGYSIDYTYDDRGNISTTKDQNDAITSYQYDELDRLIYISLPPNYISLQPKVFNEPLEYSFTYDENSNIVSTTLLGTDETYKYIYNEYNQLTNTIQPDQSSLSLFTYELDKLKTITNRKGEVTEFTYDPFHRLKLIATRENSREYVYGDSFKSTESFLDTLTNKLKSKTEYDGFGRVSRVLEQSNDTSEYEVVAEYTYDKNHNLVEIKDGEDHLISFEYECANILKSTENSAHIISEYFYKGDEGALDCDTSNIDGRLFKIKDALGNDVTFDYKEKETTTTFSDGKKITNRFDPQTLIEKFTNEASKVWTKHYDLQGNLITEISPLGSIYNYETQYFYEVDGKLSRVVYPNKNSQVYAYNENSELQSSEVFDEHGNLEESFTYNYSSYGNLESIIDTSDNSDQIVREFDNFNRLKSVEFVPVNRKIVYEYNEQSLLKSKSFKQNGVLEDYVEYLYNERGLVKSIIDNTSETFVSIKYNKINQLKDLTYPNGTIKLLEYDVLGRLSDIVYKDVTDVEQFKIHYEYYVNNQIKNETRSGLNIDNIKKEYIYDNRNRLKVVTIYRNDILETTENYTYSAVGNKTKTVIDGVTKDVSFDENNRVIRVDFTDGSSAIDYVYNNNGNLISKDLGNDSYNFTYNGRNKLVQIQKTKDFAITEFSYEYYPNSDLRMSVSKSGDINYFVYEEQNEKYVLDSSKNTISSYMNLPFGYDSRLYSKEPNESDEDEIFFTDALNSIRGTFQEDSPTKLRIQDYTAYGEIKNSSLLSQNLSIGFTGRVEDSETKLKYFRGRYLDTDSGTFTQVDPMQDGTNWYAYVGGDPINNNDPSGYYAPQIAFFLSVTTPHLLRRAAPYARPMRDIAYKHGSALYEGGKNLGRTGWQNVKNMGNYLKDLITGKGPSASQIQACEANVNLGLNPNSVQIAQVTNNSIVQVTKNPVVKKIIENINSDRYLVVDMTDKTLHAWAQVSNRVLEIDMRTKNIQTGLRSTVLKGKEQFRNIVQHFRNNFDVIKGNWNKGTNLDQFNGLVQQGMDPIKAAMNTWTGQQAAASGYVNATITRASQNADGAYTSVKVLFSK